MHFEFSAGGAAEAFAIRRRVGSLFHWQDNCPQAQSRRKFLRSERVNHQRQHRCFISPEASLINDTPDTIIQDEANSFALANAKCRYNVIGLLATDT